MGMEGDNDIAKINFSVKDSAKNQIWNWKSIACHSRNCIVQHYPYIKQRENFGKNYNRL